jgi:hypothetical protein
MEYVDLYLIHWPVCMKPGPIAWPTRREDAVPFDFEGVWRAMEGCQRLGLARAIGVSNFTTRHLDRVLAATIPPAVNQVELNPACGSSGRCGRTAPARASTSRRTRRWGDRTGRARGRAAPCWGPRCSRR